MKTLGRRLVKVIQPYSLLFGYLIFLIIFLHNLFYLLKSIVHEEYYRVLKGNHQQSTVDKYLTIEVKIFQVLVKDFKINHLYLSSLLNCVPCEPSRLRALPIINTRLRALPIINSRLRALTLNNKRLIHLCLALCCYN